MQKVKKKTKSVDTFISLHTDADFNQKNKTKKQNHHQVQDHFFFSKKACTVFFPPDY